MNIVIRADASTEIASGHIIRCTTLAMELKKRGAKITFVCRNHKGHMADYIDSKGFDVRLLPEISSSAKIKSTVPHAAWLKTEPLADALDFQKAISDLPKPDWLIVDHYAIDAVWEKATRPLVNKIFVIDDLADREHDCDILLDQNYFSEGAARYRNLVESACRILSGPRYALLRPEFSQFAKESIEREPARILAFFGAAEKSHMTLRTAKILVEMSRSRKISADVVIGFLNPDHEEIVAVCKNSPEITVHEGHADMAYLMSRASIGIGAGGSTTWERSCLGLASIVISLAAHQDSISRELAEIGGHIFLGRDNKSTDESLKQALLLLIDNESLRTALAKNSRRITDGKGVMRVGEILFPLAVDLRKAEPSDEETLYAWRNHPDTRRFALNPQELSRTDHAAWFRDTLQNNTRILLVAHSKGLLTGVVRLDVENDTAKISIYTDPGLKNLGYGTAMLKSTESWILKNQPTLKKITAEILPSNRASQNIFLKAGYLEHHWVYERTLNSENR